MSLDRSLKSGGSLLQHRTVLTRAERIAKLMDKGKFTEESSPLGLPKVATKRATTGKKKKAKGPEEGDAADGAAAAKPAAG
ncbi:MAG: small basic protein [Phycisphaerales bacterium]